MARLPVSRRSFEYFVFLFATLFLSNAVVRMLSGGYTDLVTSGGDRRFELVLSMIYLIVLAIGFAHFARLTTLTLHVPALIGLLFLAFASALWAEMPSLVFRRTIGLAGATAFGLVFAACFDFEEQLKLLRQVVRIATALTLAAWALGPMIGSNIVSGEETTIKGYQVQIESGAWRGIYNHKNMLGAAMALAILVEWHLPGRKFSSKIFRGVWLVAYAALLLLSHSVTSLVAVGFTIMLMFTFKAFRHQYRVIVPILLMIAICAGMFIALYGSSVTQAVGRSDDLSGRMELWQWVTTMIRDRPLLGYGFSGFWKGASDQSDLVESRIGWSPEYSHNGYLEITLSLGIVGLLLFLWFAATGIKRTTALAKHADSVQDLWPLAFLIYFLIHNLGECTIAWQNSLEWALCVATVVSADPRLYASFASAHEEVIPSAEPEYS